MEIDLLETLLNYKTLKEQEGKNFDSDLIVMYETVRHGMSQLYPGDDFGPINDAIEDTELSPNEIKKESLESRKKIKEGYEKY